MASDGMKFLKKIADNILIRVPSGENVAVKSLWEEQTVVIYFLRRFGCPICQYLSRQLSKIKPQLDEHNVKLVGVGPEELGSKEFYDAKHFAGELFYDPEKKSYKDMNYRRYNVLNVLGGALGSKSRELANLAGKEGLKGNLSGDLMQTGGMLIVKKGGEVLLDFKQKDASDHLENQTILETLGIQAKSSPVDDSEIPACSLNK